MTVVNASLSFHKVVFKFWLNAFKLGLRYQVTMHVTELLIEILDTPAQSGKYHGSGEYWQ